MSTGFQVSLKDALLSQRWDYITLQQVSHLSIDYETYQPYLNELVAYVRKCCPKAKIFLQEAWAYEKDSKRLVEELKYDSPELMYQDIQVCYARAMKDACVDGLIPTGKLMQNIVSAGVSKIHRDTFHASWGIGRYAIGLLWYKVLTGKMPVSERLPDFDEEVNESDLVIVRKCVQEF